MINKKRYPNSEKADQPRSYNKPKTRVSGAGTIVGDCHPKGCMWRAAKSVYESQEDGTGRGCGMVIGLCRSNGIGEG